MGGGVTGIRSYGQFLSPIILVKKATTWRMGSDYQELNNWIIKYKFLFPSLRNFVRVRRR